MMERAGPVADALGCVGDTRAALTESSARASACAAATLT
jgi:hypothetical protein